MADNHTASPIPPRKTPCWKRGFRAGCLTGVVVVVVLDILLMGFVPALFFFTDAISGTGGGGPVANMGKGAAILLAVLLMFIVLPLFSIIGLIIGALVGAILRRRSS